MIGFITVKISPKINKNNIIQNLTCKSHKRKHLIKVNFFNKINQSLDNI